MKISYLKVLHPVHVPGVGQINASAASGLTIDNSKLRDLTMEACQDGVLLETHGKTVLIPFSNVAYAIVAE